MLRDVAPKLLAASGLLSEAWDSAGQGVVIGTALCPSHESCMILTGPAIEAAAAKGDILIDPFDSRHVNPNSYNYHLFPEIYKVSVSDRQREVCCVPLPATGLLLEPEFLYLGCTDELFHSTKYAMTLLGRSSMGRLGLFVNISSDLGHVGSRNRWTLEITVVQPVIVYPHQCIGQVAFWETAGTPNQYAGQYLNDERPYPSKDAHLFSFQGETSL